MFPHRAGADLSVRYVALRCLDGYCTNIDMANPIQPQTILALDFEENWSRNGVRPGAGGAGHRSCGQGGVRARPASAPRQDPSPARTRATRPRAGLPSPLPFACPQLPFKRPILLAIARIAEIFVGRQ